MQGVARHFLGDQAEARRRFAAGFERAGERNLQLCGNDHRVRGLITLSRVLWLSGLPDQAMKTAQQAVSAAMTSGKPLDTCFALLYTVPVYLWCGRWEAAQDVLDQLFNHTHWQVLKPFHAIASAMQGALLIGRGDAADGLPALVGVLQEMREDRQNVVATFIACSFAEGLTRAGRSEEALGVIRVARRAAMRGGEAVHLPELLRVQANALASLSQAHEARAIRLLGRSCRIARRQSALSWELRSTLTLVDLQARRGGGEQTLHRLSTIYGRFTEGFATSDLKAAAETLSKFDHSPDACRLAEVEDRALGGALSSAAHLRSDAVPAAGGVAGAPIGSA
jgi:hypothetical protein